MELTAKTVLPPGAGVDGRPISHYWTAEVAGGTLHIMAPETRDRMSAQVEPLPTPRVALDALERLEELASRTADAEDLARTVRDALRIGDIVHRWPTLEELLAAGREVFGPDGVWTIAPHPGVRPLSSPAVVCYLATRLPQPPAGAFSPDLILT